VTTGPASSAVAGGAGAEGAETRRFVCVTGMHRSGTSAVARVLDLLGVDFGDRADLLGGLHDNPEGFWESLPIVRLDEALLWRAGGSWDDPPWLDDGWESEPALDDARTTAERLVDRAFVSGSVAGWKDPRTSLVLPFWRTVVSVDRTVLVLRDPREVARSVAVRNRFGPERAAYLWLRYTVAAWRADSTRVVVSYDDLLRDPWATTRYLAGALELPTPDDAVEAGVGEAVRAELRHGDGVRSAGPVMRLAVAHHDLLASGDWAGVDTASEELRARWAAVRRRDRRWRRPRVLARRLAPWGVRRRIRSRVGAVTSLALRRATVPVR